MANLLSEFDFDLPRSQIALRPEEPREKARLLVIQAGGELIDAHIGDLPEFFDSGTDCMLVNNSKVIPAQLSAWRFGRQKGGGDPKRKVEIDLTLFEQIEGMRWKAFARPLRRCQIGDELFIGPGFSCHITKILPGQYVELNFDMTAKRFEAKLHIHGQMPLPPYIASQRRTDHRDALDYQTIYAQQEGSFAAPTAGLHFTPELLEQFDKKKIPRFEATLHVGPGTFLPVKTEQLAAHELHAEWCELSGDQAKQLLEHKKQGGKITAIGTTSARLLESAWRRKPGIAFSGQTRLFIKPGDPFLAVDRLLTNFHLPKSTLFMLVCALAGTERMQKAYAHAVEKGYRFFSYGDACLIESAI